MNVSGWRRLTPGPLTGVWFRAVRQHHYPTALAYDHTRTTPGRFNPGSDHQPGFPVLYLSENSQMCLFEVGALWESPGSGGSVIPNPAAGPWAVFPVTVRLSRVVDLCDDARIRVLGTSIQELTGDWRGYVERAVRGLRSAAPTQLLGDVLFTRAKVEGLLTYSAKDPVRRNLVVFPTRLRANSSIELLDPATGRGHRLGHGGTLSPAP